MSQPLTLSILPERFAVCRLSTQTAVPLWATTGPFWAITHTADELSIVCPQEAVPTTVPYEGDWACFKVEGPLDFALTGILAALAMPLAAAAISIFAISTYDTDYLLVKESKLAAATAVLQQQGHHVRPMPWQSL